MNLTVATTTLPQSENLATASVVTVTESSVTTTRPSGTAPVFPSGMTAMAALPLNFALANTGIQIKKKRGRPRKYGPDGATSLALVPVLSHTGVDRGSSFTGKRGRGRAAGSVKHLDIGYSGEWAECMVGGNFTPHVVTVASGEDVTMKVISFSQQGPRAVCILSANGAVSNVTLRQPDSSGGTLTYEGRFEILSLSGSFIPTEICGTRSSSGGMSVSLASPDGRVIGGGVAGLLIAASPVQLVIGSFMPSVQHQKPKKPRMDAHPASFPAGPIYNTEMHEKHSLPGQMSSILPSLSLTPSPSVPGDNWPSLHSVADVRNSPSTDINMPLPGG